MNWSEAIFNSYRCPVRTPPPDPSIRHGQIQHPPHPRRPYPLPQPNRHPNPSLPPPSRTHLPPPSRPFQRPSRGNRTLGYVNRGRREIALCALPPRVSLTHLKGTIHLKGTDPPERDGSFHLQMHTTTSEFTALNQHLPVTEKSKGTGASISPHPTINTQATVSLSTTATPSSTVPLFAVEAGTGTISFTLLHS